MHDDAHDSFRMRIRQHGLGHICTVPLPAFNSKADEQCTGWINPAARVGLDCMPFSCGSLSREMMEFVNTDVSSLDDFALIMHRMPDLDRTELCNPLVVSLSTVLKLWTVHCVRYLVFIGEIRN